jgi:hypothetical protein
MTKIISNVSKKFSIATIIISILLLANPQSAKANLNRPQSGSQQVYVPLDMVSGTRPDLAMRINQRSLNLDLAKTNNIRLRFNVKDLMAIVPTQGVVSVKIYEIVSGERVFTSQNSLNLNSGARKNRIMAVDVGFFATPNKQIEIDLIDAANNVVNTYSALLQAQNLIAQASSDNNVIDFANCDNSIFGECQLDAFFQKVNFVPFRSRQPASEIVKNENGNYEVRLPYPRQFVNFYRGKRTRVRIGTAPGGDDGAVGGGGSSAFGEVVDASTLRLGSSLANYGRITYDPNTDYLIFGHGNNLVTENRVYLHDDGRLGVGVSSPSAYLHLRAGDTTNPPFKMSAGDLTTIPQDGAIEFDGDEFYVTKNGVRTLLGASGSSVINGSLFLNNTMNGVLTMLSDAEITGGVINGATLINTTLTVSNVDNANTANTADFATNAGTATFATNAGTATTATNLDGGTISNATINNVTVAGQLFGGVINGSTLINTNLNNLTVDDSRLSNVEIVNGSIFDNGVISNSVIEDSLFLNNTMNGVLTMLSDAEITGGVINGATLINTTLTVSNVDNANTANTADFATNAGTATFATNAGTATTATNLDGGTISNATINNVTVAGQLFGGVINGSTLINTNLNNLTVDDSRLSNVEIVNGSIFDNGVISNSVIEDSLFLNNTMNGVLTMLSDAEITGGVINGATLINTTLTVSNVDNATTANTADFATNAGTATFATNAGTATTATNLDGGTISNATINNVTVDGQLFGGVINGSTLINTNLNNLTVDDSRLSNVEIVNGSIFDNGVISNSVIEDSLFLNNTMNGVLTMLSDAEITGGVINGATLINTTLTVSNVDNANTANTADFATNAGTATFATNAGTATTATNLDGGTISNATINNVTVAGQLFGGVINGSTLINTNLNNLTVDDSRLSNVEIVNGSIFDNGVISNSVIEDSLFLNNTMNGVLTMLSDAEITGGVINGATLINTTLTVSNVDNANTANTADFATAAGTAAFATNAGTAITATTAGTATFATNAGTAITATTATNLDGGIISNATINDSLLLNNTMNGVLTMLSDAQIDGDVSVLGTVTATAFVGDGSGLTGIATTIINNGTINNTYINNGDLTNGTISDVSLDNGVITNSYIDTSVIEGSLFLNNTMNGVLTMLSDAEIIGGVINGATLINATLTVSNVDNATTANTADFATAAGTAAFATNAGTATFATNAGTAAIATHAGSADTATTATTATNLDGGIISNATINDSLLLNNTMNGVLTMLSDAQIDGDVSVLGTVTATAFVGDGSGLTGIATTIINNGTINNTYINNGDLTNGTISDVSLDNGVITNSYIDTSVIEDSLFLNNTMNGVLTMLSDAEIIGGVINGATLINATLTVSNVDNANTANTADFATAAGTAAFATNAGTATFATNAGTAATATHAGSADTATTATTATNLDGGIISNATINDSLLLNNTMNGVLTMLSDAQIDGDVSVLGTVTATAFVGDGSGLTGIATTIINNGTINNTYINNGDLTNGTISDVSLDNGVITNSYIDTSVIEDSLFLNNTMNGVLTMLSDAEIIGGVINGATLINATLTVSNVDNANTANTADFATAAGTAAFATNAGTATFATNAGTAATATHAGSADTATTATTATNLDGGIISNATINDSLLLNNTMNGVLTMLSDAQIDGDVSVLGTVTATAFVGDGSGLTGIATTIINNGTINNTYINNGDLTNGTISDVSLDNGVITNSYIDTSVIEDSLFLNNTMNGVLTMLSDAEIIGGVINGATLINATLTVSNVDNATTANTADFATAAGTAAFATNAGTAATATHAGSADTATTATTATNLDGGTISNATINNATLAGQISGGVINGVTLVNTVVSSANNAISADKVIGEVALSTSSVTNINAGTGLIVTKAIMRVQGNGGNVNITAVPQLSPGANDGEILIIRGMNNSATVTFEDGNGLILDGGVPFEMGDLDMLTLIYDAIGGVWVEISRMDR